MRVTVKASKLVKAMKPEVWPSRDGVRHYSQSAQTGSRLKEGGVGRRQQGNRCPRVPSSRQQPVNQPALKLMMENMFGLLGEQTFP